MQTLRLQFGLAHFARFGRLPSSTSRIVFVYGLADPWHNSGLPVFGPTGNLKRQLNSETEVLTVVVIFTLLLVGMLPHTWRGARAFDFLLPS
eukprot:SAG31_NODE_5332_length_2603_cov_2.775958_4_plen_92_part_00